MNIKIIRGGAASKERWDPRSIALQIAGQTAVRRQLDWRASANHSSIVIEPRQLFDHAAG
jgi:hypothetical protein